MKQSSGGRETQATSTLEERLLFVIWLSAKVLGTNTGAALAEAVGKNASQLSKWLSGAQRPSWPTIKVLAGAVRISASWLDNPQNGDAVEPHDFPEWIAAQRGESPPEQKASAGA